MNKTTILILLAFAFLSACATDIDYDKMSVEELYNAAHDNLDKTRYKKSAELFEKVETEYPYSKWATEAKLMGAYAHYKDGKYDDTIMATDRFVRFHPANPNVSYAYYLKAMSYYDQISAVDREQSASAQAYAAFEHLVLRFPNSKYTADARQRMILATDNMAGKEMEVGRYYLKTSSYLSALNRFSEVVNQYQTTVYIEEALYRQVEIYTILGLNSEARNAYNVLSFNYPDGEWTKKASGVLGAG